MKRLVLVIAMVSSASAQPPPSAQTVLANVQKFYAGAKQMTAKFRQEVTNTAFGKAGKSDGELYVVKPSDLRFDYLMSKQGAVVPQKTFVFNGSTMWFVDHVNKKIYQSNVQDPVLPAALSFLTGGGNLATQFNIAASTSGKYGKAGMIVLELTPKQPSAQYKQLYFVVDASNWHINESIVIDANGDTNDFHFYAPDLQAPISTQLFQVNPASLPTYQIVQAPSQAVPTRAPSPAPTPPKPSPKTKP